MARPSSYTREVGVRICEEIAEGKSIRQIVASENMPSRATVYNWLRDNKEFLDQYERAREEAAELFAQEIIEIADSGENDTYVDDKGNKRTDWDVLGRSKLRVDARKWIASKLLPKKYGELVQQRISGADGGPVVFVREFIDK